MCAHILGFSVPVALARVLFPREAKLAMEIANAHSTSEFAGLAASKASCGNLREVDLNEIPYEQVKRLQLRLQALQKTGNYNLKYSWNFEIKVTTSLGVAIIINKSGKDLVVH